jgi:catechol 2,3-dioxygenase-like lactoylglutathione lyase family enzyme
MHLEALDHIGLAVDNVDRSIRWYQDVLGLIRVHEETWGDFPAVLVANGSGIALFPRDGTPNIARGDDDMGHIGFRTSRRGLEQAKAEAGEKSIEYHEGDYCIAWSIYFDDPDGHQIEITTYEPPAG